ncbi:hypothetical protein A1O1_07329 [Capronia coronata CBS 617.96]|uniref:RanBP2-type domain-containing protein n=1 Tax=Capronia coronata CBS 617.96 TaxID=1182541 RepID=W9Y227_9EURO|nr:uncharacterized protein A1O1_07329 [Capronia coronata CBS 617.96]EXJ83705.1 hypothetical protein A1O1_07329 [Capronia coronata CBS 617.96]
MPEKKKRVGPVNAWLCCQCNEANPLAIHADCPKCGGRKCPSCREVHLRPRSPSRNEDRRPPR